MIPDDENPLSDPAIRRRVAFHEAGHAVTHWLFGTAGDFYEISMVPDALTLAHVRSKGFVTSPELAASYRQIGMSVARAFGARFILHNLAGPCAENRVDEERDNDWLDNLIDENFGWSDDEEESHDVVRAIRIAFAVEGEFRRRAWSLLRRVGRWADEIYAVPRVWRTVEALALHLQTNDQTGADVAWSIMEKAWGPDAGTIPIWSLGRGWRRRFYPPVIPPTR